VRRATHLFIPLVAAALLGLAAPSCGPDPAEACARAYEHLLHLGQRPSEPELRERFITTCVEARDEGQVKCILSADTPEAATSCKATRKRPG